MNKAERRKNSIKKARRKQRLAKELYELDYYDSLHQFSKNKIHCSCPMCSGMNKTNQKKFKGNGKTQHNNSHYGTTNNRKGKNWKFSEYKKILSMKEDMECVGNNL